MKKNGFTLIEVIGTMVILSIILLIVSPIIKDSFNAAKRELTEEQIASLENVARIWATKNSDKLSEEEPKYLTIEELKTNGLIENKEILKMNSKEKLKGCIKIFYDNNKYNYKYESSVDTCFIGQYQQVEYIESTGTQYISNFYVVPSSYTTLEFEAKTNSNYIQEQGVIGINSKLEFGYSVIANRLILWEPSSGSVGYNSTESIKNKDIVIKGTLREGVYRELYVSVDGGKTEKLDAKYTSINNENVNLMIYKGSKDYTFKGKLYYAKVTVDGNLTRNMIPCYRKIDNVAGMCDLVNKEFYTNSGTGEFIVGNKI